jgi:hypothetical protein
LLRRALHLKGSEASTKGRVSAAFPILLFHEGGSRIPTYPAVSVYDTNDYEREQKPESAVN